MNNNIALIFGATGQLGGEIANELSKLNTTLILVGKNQEKLKKINEGIKNNLKKKYYLSVHRFKSYAINRKIRKCNI